MAFSSVCSVGHQLQAGYSDGLCGLRFIIEQSQMSLLAVDLDLGSPLSSINPTVDPSKLRCRSDMTALVLKVGSSLAWKFSKIRAAAVEFVAILVVAFHPVTWSQSEKLSVQPEGYGLAIFIPATEILGATSVAVSIKGPRPLARPCCVSRVDDGVGTDGTVPSSERDARGQAIVAQLGNGGAAAPLYATGSRTVASPTTLHVCGMGRELTTAFFSGARSGTLLRHRWSPTQTGDVEPRVVQPTSGLLRVNYTRGEV